MHSTFPQLSATPGAVGKAGRALGADNDEVFRTLLGLTEKKLTGLRVRGVA